MGKKTREKQTYKTKRFREKRKPSKTKKEFEMKWKKIS
jgi:hypothetical protein